MQYTQLGNSGIEIPRFTVGCMSFGDRNSNFHAWTLNQEETDSVVQHALNLGLTFFDTANVYAAGTSEEYLGKALKKYANRKDVQIATKVYFNEGALGKEAIQREIDASLRRLGTDYVDLYIIHRFDYDHPMEEYMEALHQLVVAGKVRALGASAMYGFQFSNLQRVAQDNGFTRFVSMQNHYNLLYREDERELIPICKEQNVALTPYSPLASGRLSRTEWSTDTERSRLDATAVSKYDSTKETDEVIVGRVSELAGKHGCTMSQIALAWHFARGVAAPIVGATKARYLDDAVGALDVQLTPDDVAYLEEPYVPHKLVGLIPHS